MKRFALLGIIVGWSIILHAQENSPKKTLSNEDIWAKNYFAAKSINGLQSMKDGKRYSSFYTDPNTKQNYILAYSYATGKVTDTIVSEADLQIKLPNEIVQIKLEDYYFSDDEKYIIITNAVLPNHFVISTTEALKRCKTYPIMANNSLLLFLQMD